MPANTPIHGFPYPVPADPIDTAGDIQRLAEAIDVDPGFVHVFPTITELKAFPNPPLGMLAVVADASATGWGVCRFGAGGWLAERYYANAVTTTATGGIFLDAPQYGFTTFSMVQVEVRKTFPVAGGAMSVQWTSIDAGNTNATVMVTDYQPSGISTAPNRAVQFIARLFGVL